MGSKTLSNWKSHEAMEETIRRDTVAVADALHVSESLVRKWKEAPSTLADPDQSGARNPLDRIETVIAAVERIDPGRAYLPIKWLCARFSFCPPIKMSEVKPLPEDVQGALLNWTREFGQTCEEVSRSLADGRVSKAELKRVYREVLDDFEAAMGLFMQLKELADI